MRKLLLALAATVWFVCGALTPAMSGQMSSHIYTAIRSQEFLTGLAAKCVKKFEAEYLAGAQGPDTTGVVQHALDSGSLKRSVGEETHYDPLKAELALNMLDCARDFRELAYAVGWISHYINDIHIHATVNQYGGFYEVAAYHHKELEQLETMHVIKAHGDIVTQKRSELDYDTMGDDFPEFIFNAYAATFPANDLYKAGKEGYFCERYKEAAGWCSSASKAFYDTATRRDKNGKHNWELATVKFPNMPSFDDYDHFQSAIEIKDVKAGKDKLIAKIRINDSKVYGRFLVDWEAAADASVAYAKKPFALVSAYVEENDPAKKAALRADLLAAIPNANLDQPVTGYDNAKIHPGDKSYKTPYCSCTFTPSDGSATPVEVTGLAPGIKVESTGWSGSEIGETTVEIPVPAGAYPYQYELKVAITGKDAFANSAYYTRDWVQTSGGTDTGGDSRVTVGEVFDVSVELTPELAKLPGRRVWLVMNDSPNNEGTHLKGSVNGKPIAFTLSRQSVGKLPGNREFIAELGNHRYDVAAISESMEGNTLKARLQVTNPALQKHLGEQWLVCVLLDHEQSSTMEYTEALQKWNECNKNAKPVYAAIDEKVESLSEAKRKQLQAEGEKYQMELREQNLSEAEIEELMEKKYFEIMKSIGVQIGPEQQALLDAAEAADEVLKSKSNIYNCAFGKFILQPVEIQLQPAEGWTVAEPTDETEAIRKTLGKNLSSSDYPGMGASCSLSVTCTDDPEAEAKFARSQADSKGTRSAIQLGPYTGTIIESNTETDDSSEYSSSQLGEALLSSGKTYMRISYNLHTRGFKDQNYSIDGRASAKSTAAAVAKEADAMIKSIKLVAKEVEK